VSKIQTAVGPHRRDRAVNRRVQGDLGEFSAMEWLASKGALVWTPMSHSPDVDLMADFDGRLVRIQVKTSTLRVATPKGGERWNVSIATRGGNRSWSGSTKHFDPHKVDYLFALVGDGRRWMIPAQAIEARSQVALGTSSYADFEIERGTSLDQLVYPDSPARLELPPQRGGAPESGEPGRPVKSVALLEWVRVPPPPSPPPADVGYEGSAPLRFQRTRISPKHQVTIPSVAFRGAGLNPGDRLQASADGVGRVILERIEPLELAKTESGGG
jgi:hypothetical protein